MEVAILAHGALGWWDEIIYVTIAIIFLVFMVISWLRSRNTDIEEQPSGDSPQSTSPSESPEHFRLD